MNQDIGFTVLIQKTPHSPKDCWHVIAQIRILSEFSMDLVFGILALILAVIVTWIVIVKSKKYSN